MCIRDRNRPVRGPEVAVPVLQPARARFIPQFPQQCCSASRLSTPFSPFSTPRTLTPPWPSTGMSLSTSSGCGAPR
eukprot:9682186-Lingulodinium_polyedra.AAC.1